MRHVHKDQAAPPAILANPETFASLEQLIQTRDKNLIDSKLYRVAVELEVLYHNKCAYCENYCKTKVEHYRPKKGVIREPRFPGYYWLSYEWTNLVAACQDCNEVVEGKGNKFPIAGSRAMPPSLTAGEALDRSSFNAHTSPLIDEKPYLLHPEIDNPDEFLGIELAEDKSGIVLKGIDTEGRRGEMTIEICNLNRPNLNLDRYQALAKFINAVNETFLYLKEGWLAEENLGNVLALHLKQLQENGANPYEKYTLMYRFIMKDEQSFQTILPLFDPSQHAILLAVFSIYSLQE